MLHENLLLELRNYITNLVLNKMFLYDKKKTWKKGKLQTEYDTTRRVSNTWTNFSHKALIGWDYWRLQ